MARVVEELFVELFAGAYAGVLDVDVFVGLVAVEANERFGHFGYFDRRAHVEDEQLAARAHRPGLEDEADRFGNEHEVALHVWVRDGDGAARRYLAFELRHDAAAASENVAETHGHVLRLGEFFLDGEQQTLGGAFCRAHDAGRMYGLICRYHDEALDAVFPG